MMATTQAEVENKILEQISQLLEERSNYHTRAKAVEHLAEAWAWLQSPDQPHGGNVNVSGS